MHWLFLFLLNILVIPVAPIVVIPFAFLQRVPYWMNTPDDPGLDMQGLYEPQVLKVRERFGQRVKTWYWLGVRNQMMGLFYLLSPKATRADAIRKVDNYPQSKNPYRSGFAVVRAIVRGTLYREFCLVWGWPWTNRCGQVRCGWKLQEMDVPGPVMFCFQVKPLLTRDSTT